MSSIIDIVTVENKPNKAKAIIAELIQEFKGKYDLVHVANCESILSVEHVLNSLVTTPGALICSGRWFEDEDEEVREIARRLLPDIKLIMVPSDLTIEAGDKDKAIVEYLKEHVEAWKAV